jgi:hypothetical protein
MRALARLGRALAGCGYYSGSGEVMSLTVGLTLSCSYHLTGQEGSQAYQEARKLTGPARSRWSNSGSRVGIDGGHAGPGAWSCGQYEGNRHAATVRPGGLRTTGRRPEHALDSASQERSNEGSCGITNDTQNYRIAIELTLHLVPALVKECCR